MTRAGDWFPLARATASARLSLFCFHHAGGGASAFAEWRRRLAPEIDVLAPLLPGREQRLDEDPYRSMPALMAGLVPAMRPWLDRPFALFGHSFGAAVAFELARQLPGTPAHLFVSSWVPPSPAQPALPPLTDREFIVRMARYGGLPDALVNDPEVMGVLLKSMRADVQILDTYRPALDLPLRCRTTILGGADDAVVQPQHLARWVANSQTSAPVLFPGGHFYLRQSVRALLDTLVATLLPGRAAAFGR